MRGGTVEPEVVDVHGTQRYLTWTAFSLMALFGLLGGLFVVGYAFEDLGARTASGLTLLWVGPTVGLSVLALRRPTSATTVLTWATGVVSAATIADSLLGIVPRDDWGPVLAVVVLALGVTLAFLGLRRARRAGALMVVLALARLAATVLGVVGEPADGGPGAGALLTTSSGVVVVPVLLAGLLFLAAGSRRFSPLPAP